jgi:hypothetical protein
MGTIGACGAVRSNASLGISEGIGDVGVFGISRVLSS